MNIFDCFVKKEEKIEKDDEFEKKEVNIFSIVKNLYSLLYKLSDKEKLKEQIDIITEDCNDNDLNFICWILCHNLCHNKVTRKNIDVFVKVSYSLEKMDFIYWYFDFMFDSKIRFPMFMPWYKFGNKYSKYREYIETEYNISDEDLNDLEEYYKLSDRDIWEDLRYAPN